MADITNYCLLNLAGPLQLLFPCSCFRHLTLYLTNVVWMYCHVFHPLDITRKSSGPMYIMPYPFLPSPWVLLDLLSYFLPHVFTNSHVVLSPRLCFHPAARRCLTHAAHIPLAVHDYSNLLIYSCHLYTVLSNCMYSFFVLTFLTETIYKSCRLYLPISIQ